MKFCILFTFLTLFVICYGGIVPNPEHPAYLTARRKNFDQFLDPNENYKEYWLEKGKKFVENQIKLKENKNKAKNIIFFIGDGMSLTTLAASRVYQGGEEKPLSFENFPYTGLAQTYVLDKLVADSASTSTAYLTGVKANYGTIGVNGNIKRKDCKNTLDTGNYTYSIGKWALDAGKSIGFVTTTRVTHASPAGLYAHAADRNWENDVEVKNMCENKNNEIKDIADQLIHNDVGSKITVVLGGGRREFRDKNLPDEQDLKNKRKDKRDLIEEWKNNNDNGKINKTYVFDRKGLLNVDSKTTDKLMGLFNSGHMSYYMEAEEWEPTLEEMTRKAIELLKIKSGDNGFFLFVEGGLIDVAHHGTYAQIAFNETIEFSKAIETAKKMTNEEDTLIVVSSDHSHTMSISGYPDRHNDILDVASVSHRDNLPFLTINYANGEGADDYINLETNSRKNPLEVHNKKNPRSVFPSSIYQSSETHGGEDVAVFASGPWAHLFTGVYEQNVLPHLMAYAACIGNGLKHC